MNLRERLLYHQIHPAKLLTDWITTIPTLYLLWQHDLILGLLVAFVPSLAASILLIRLVNLEKYKQSKFGKYLSNYMTKTMQTLRFVGFILMMLGAWFHSFWFLIPLGIVVILLAWLRGIIVPRTKAAEI